MLYLKDIYGWFDDEVKSNILRPGQFFRNFESSRRLSMTKFAAIRWIKLIYASNLR